MILARNLGKFKSEEELVKTLVRLMYQHFDPIDTEYEILFAIGMDVAENILYVDVVSMGSDMDVFFTAAKVFKRALAEGARYVILAHTHPGEEKVKLSKIDRESFRKTMRIGNQTLVLPYNTIAFSFPDGAFDSFYKNRENNTAIKRIKKERKRMFKKMEDDKVARAKRRLRKILGNKKPLK
jgi:hypothetical protein